MRIIGADLQSEGFKRRLSELSPLSDLVWATGMAVGLGFTMIAAFFFAYPLSSSGKFWAYAGLLIRASMYLWSGDRLPTKGGEVLSRLFLLGLVAGVVELLADWWLEKGIRYGRLVYLTGNDVVLLGSPIWMPVAWACVIVELGYPALRLYERFQTRGPARSFWMATVPVAMAAGMTVGLYEVLAFRAGWWKYQPAHVMIGRTCALYIPLGEIFMFLPGLLLYAHVLKDDKRRLASIIESGWIFGLSIFAGYALAYVLLEVL